MPDTALWTKFLFEHDVKNGKKLRRPHSLRAFKNTKGKSLSAILFVYISCVASQNKISAQKFRYVAE